MDARCGDPNLPINSDERQIRSLINAYPGKFYTIDAVIEWSKAVYHIGEAAHPGTGFRSDPEHYLFLGGPGRFDFLAKNLSSIALALDRLQAASIGKERNLKNFKSSVLLHYLRWNGEVLLALESNLAV